MCAFFFFKELAHMIVRTDKLESCRAGQSRAGKGRAEQGRAGSRLETQLGRML